MQPLTPPQPIAQDDEFQRIQFDFTGAWLPDLHPIKVGINNYTDVENIRYTKTGVSVCFGYSKINATTALTKVNGLSGAQLRTPFTQKSYIITQQFDGNLANGELRLHKGVPPATGDFEVTALHTDASGAGVGRFTEAPDNNLIYCNGIETKVFSGDESAIGVFLYTGGVSGLTLTSPYDYTDIIRDNLNIAASRVAIGKTPNCYVIGTTRPIDSIYVYIALGNATAATSVAVSTWSGTTWSGVSGLSDGTASGGITHAQSGRISWTSSVGTSVPAIINDQLLYWYTFTLSDGSCEIYHVTYRAPFQNLVDLWDGVNRVCLQYQVGKSSVFRDYTPDVYDPSNATYPIAADLSGLTSSDSVILMFNERQTALKYTFIAGLTNAAAATITIKYWNGSAFTTVGTVYDGTLDSGGTKTHAQNGTIAWNPPSASSEFRKMAFGMFMYAYEITFSNTLTAKTVDSFNKATAGVFVDTVYGVPAVKTIGAYKFGFMYKNRLFLAGDVVAHEGHGIDFAVKDTADCFNGPDSSADGKRLYVGKASADLVAAANVFNRFGANIYNSELLLKSNETYLLDGDNPDNFIISQVSENVGIISPYTLATAEVAFEVNRDAIRNIAIWLSASGPVIFDAAIIIPIEGVDLYFNRNMSTCMNFSAANRAHGWYDPTYFEYNLCLPVGTGQTSCNVWLAYDLVNKRWTKRSVGSQYVPQATLRVIDNLGAVHIYGLIGTGHMVNLENGLVWNDTENVNGSVTTGLILPTGSIFDITMLRRIIILLNGSLTTDISYTRADIAFVGAGYTSGYLRLYGDIIEDEDCTVAHYDGDDFICKELIEEASITGNYSDAGGVFSIKYTIDELFQMQITTAAGDFVTAGFIPGLLIYTTSTLNPGPFLCTTVNATTITSSSGRAVEEAAGSRTLTATFLSILYRGDGETTLTQLDLSDIKTTDQYTQFRVSCNKTGLCHTVKINFFSQGLDLNVEPVVCGIDYSVERLNG
jgi:hypothetical protein